ncbi:exo-alpha-sialidase [Streptomyces kunmingensis]|uniref:exo-alpha-sialidase n=1 Tax=Streptomyces kunmingensis TaxID=68225 RepID=A0ABU6CF77_9ACTN|nr:exo-alpha-sialidase [Streptomyces kunmingensis]MEB3963355.1 exo-alpha-sialidase [Streptomyces kunmingensis]
MRTRLRSAVAALAVAAALPAPVAAHAATATETPPSFEQQVLFKASQDPGYACYRIPAVVKTAKGTLLAFAEGRTNDCSDAGDIDIVVKRSEDGGRTWSPLQVVNEGAGDTHGNPAPIVDLRTGRIVLGETYNTGRTDGKNCDTPCDRTPHLQYSDDDGRSWSAPRDLSDELLPPDFNSWYATGPVHGIQLTKGRPIADDGTFRQKPSEMTLAERPDGTIYVSGREQDGTDPGHRTHAVSRDGGNSFARPFATQPDLYAPQVQCSVLPAGRGGRQLLLACPGDPDRRRTMTVRSSYDGGRTWDSFDRSTVVTTDWSGYSDLVQADRDHVGLMYEGGAVDARDEIRFARFMPDWLKKRRGADPTTDDVAPGARRAAVLGGASVTDGAAGRALSFDGVDDAVRLPYRPGIALGERDFAASVRFRYTATSGEQPFLWMGGIGTTQPQVWLRGEPASHRIIGLMTARDGAGAPRSVSVSSSSAYNDGAWHQAELRRADGQLTLTIDGVVVRSAAAVPGSVSRNSPFGVHVGQRMDSRAYFSGALDDVRVTSGGRSVVWLPLDQVRGTR